MTSSAPAAPAVPPAGTGDVSAVAPPAGDDWAVRAACRTSDPDTLFVQGAAQNRAKQLCAACPVKLECLADAMDNRVEFGVWGGLTERERRALLKRRPDVTSWRRLLEAARRDHEAARREDEAARSTPVPASPAPLTSAPLTSAPVTSAARVPAPRTSRSLHSVG